MSSTRPPLNTLQLDTILNTRVSMDYRDPAKIILGQEINAEVIMLKSLLYGSGTHIIPLTFTGCTFNAKVDIGNYQAAGTVTFNNCTFNNSVKVHFENSSFSRDSEFNNDLTIRLSQDADISNYEVKGCFVLLGESANKLTLKNINKEQDIKEQTIRINGEFTDLLIYDVNGKTLEFSAKLNISREFLVENIDISELLIGKINITREMQIVDCKVGNLNFKNVTEAFKGLNIINTIFGDIGLQINATHKTSISGGTIDTIRLFNSNQKDTIINIEKTKVNSLKS